MSLGHDPLEQDTSLVDKVLGLWRSHGMLIRPPVSPAGIHTFEARYGVRLPPAMSLIYQRADGTEDDWPDHLPFRFWPITNIRLVAEEFPDPSDPDHARYPGHFLFADYLLWSHAYAVNLSDPSSGIGSIALVGARARTQVAPSFAHFLQAYLTEPDSLSG